jgi:hypothetical protein
MKPACQNAVAAVVDLRCRLHCHTRQLIQEHPRLTSNEVGRVAAVMVEEENRVQGNRPDSAPVTYSDLRLQLAATLRHCLSLLEKTP